ncbi:MMPL family transporter [Actinocrinis puniceicyclus]|uniref:MMPL family transporter n=1 Tax=Actinocrinis puniceicyclus TaxID=977794 RepID=A0A8J8BBY9_9ACTN|nr:MMPL family transporter [Actinocrinis puniceicyclus]MBS2962965.1 MMPL family transporter [Actinocrinis puniceicyclus]
MTVVPAPAAPGTQSAGTGRLYRLGVWSALHAWQVLAFWLVLLAAAAVSAGYFSSHLTGNDNTVTGSDSQAAARLLATRLPRSANETDLVVVHSRSVAVQDEPFRQAVQVAVLRFAHASGVSGVSSPYDAPAQLIAPDGHTALIALSMQGSPTQLQRDAAPLRDLAGNLTTGQVQLYVTGSSPLAAAEVDRGDADLARAERIGFPLAAVVLLLAFGTPIAAAIPLLLGAAAALGAFGALGVASTVTSFDVFARTAVSMLAIALGIDYSLFAVTRFREELADVPTAASSRPARAVAVGRTMATAGHAVLFSGATVAVSLSGLWLVRSPKIHSMALGLATTVGVMLAVCLTLLPALLGLFGRRINRPVLALLGSRQHVPDPEHSVWARLAAAVMRRPVAVAGSVVLVIVALAVPAFGLRYGVDLGAGAVADSPAGKGYTLVSREFAPGITAPVTVVASARAPLTGAQLDAVARFTAEAAARPNVAGASSVTTVLDKLYGAHAADDLVRAAAGAPAAVAGLVSGDRTVAVITVRPRYAPDSAQTADLVRDLRAAARANLAGAGLTANVGGTAAQIVDISDESSRALPLVIAAVLATSWVMLLLAFRSLILPFKAVLMNLLTCAGAFGAAVLVFQDGHGAALVGASRTGFVQVMLPLFSFALVFGLSMDYEIFMISRMREEWRHCGDNRRAVRLGLARSARVITAAAAIMVVVFASFMFTGVLEIKQLGFMLALAVLIDASIVRLLLVPALMRLMGRWNWWLPARLDRTLPGSYAER